MLLSSPALRSKQEINIIAPQRERRLIVAPFRNAIFELEEGWSREDRVLRPGRRESEFEVILTLEPSLAGRDIDAVAIAREGLLAGYDVVSEANAAAFQKEVDLFDHDSAMERSG